MHEYVKLYDKYCQIICKICKAICITWQICQYAKYEIKYDKLYDMICNSWQFRRMSKIYMHNMQNMQNNMHNMTDMNPPSYICIICTPTLLMLLACQWGGHHDGASGILITWHKRVPTCLTHVCQLLYHHAAIVQQLTNMVQTCI